jgi:hypothetical protein
MRPDELERLTAQAEAAGQDSIVLKVYRKNPPARSRVRVMPGVTGDLACWNQDAMGTFAACYVRTADLRAALRRMALSGRREALPK